jgi:hypothetical protein
MEPRAPGPCEAAALRSGAVWRCPNDPAAGPRCTAAEGDRQQRTPEAEAEARPPPMEIETQSLQMQMYQVQEEETLELKYSNTEDA